MTSEFKRNIQKIYGGKKVGRDKFGRRAATPAEVHRTLHPSNNFEDMERFYPPTALDIQEKND